MGDFYKLTGERANRHTDWTTEVVLEKDDDGNPTKAVSTNLAAELTAKEKKQVEELGYKVAKVSKEEADELRQTAATSSDVVGTAPVFGDSEEADQNE